jgi:hypothetical protein
VPEFVEVVVRTGKTVIQEQEVEFVEAWHIPKLDIPDDWEYMTDDEKVVWAKSERNSEYWVHAHQVLTPKVIITTETDKTRSTITVKGAP